MVFSPHRSGAELTIYKLERSVGRPTIRRFIMATDRDVVLVEGVRTPFAKAGSKLKDIHPAELGRIAVHELIERANLDTELVDEVIMGNTGSPSDAVNIARVIAL